jgi:hypothetical protein
MPTRVIDVGTEADEPRLLITRGCTGRYITLSHCWGVHQPLVTTADTLDERRRSIPMIALPPLLRDAVDVVRKLGFRYLWIDSLCILQGDRQDWENECGRMADVYANSALTIAGPGASSCFSTLLHARPRTQVRPFMIDVSVNAGPAGDVVAELYFRNNEDRPREDQGPLRRRELVLQERLLSPRVLYFGTKQLYFECNEMEAYGCLPHHVKAPKFNRSITSLF